MSDIITQSRFIRFLKYSPYFVWNDIGTIMNEHIFFDEDSQNENTFEWVKIDEKEKHQIIYSNYEKIKYSHGLVKAINIIDKFTNIFFEKYNGKIYFIKSKKRDDAVTETLNVINSDYDLIINPVFKYKEGFCFPKAYFVNKHKLVIQKYSASTKKEDWYRVWWDYQIAKHSCTIRDINLLVFTRTGNRKGEINFELLDGASTTKSSSKCSKLNKELNFKDIFIAKKNIKIPKKISYLLTINLDDVIDTINKYKSYTKYEDFTLKDELSTNEAELEDNYFCLLLNYHNHPTSGFSGKLIRVKDIKNLISNDIKFFEYMSQNSQNLLGTINNKQDYINKEAVKNIIEELDNSKNRIVWFDFEGFSLPVATIDYFPPYRQTVFQVSIIETKLKNGIHKVVNKVNKIYDPQTISGDDFADIINSIYQLQADYFVVYNAAYERSRIKEMVNWLLENNHPFAHQEQEKASWIINRTIDLAELFCIHSKKKFPPIFLHELKGKYSIKDIEKYIHRNKIDLPLKIKKYSELDIQNGQMAMSLATDRALGVLNDYKWSQKKEQLKIYCENDVYSMIMVYYFAKKLLLK